MTGTGGAAVAALLLAAVAGCAPLIENQSAPLDFFVLTATPPASPRPPTPPPDDAFTLIALPRLPEYLQQKWMVTRSGENEIALADDDQWASPLADNIAAVLAENLATLVGSDRFLVVPAPAGVPRGNELHLDVSRFERQPDGHVLLSGRWSLIGNGGRSLLAMRSVNLRATDAAAGPAEIAASMSALLGELAADVAGALPSRSQAARPRT